MCFLPRSRILLQEANSAVVPLNIRAQVKADIEADVMKGILERVLAGEPDSFVLEDGDSGETEWKGEENCRPLLPQ